MYLSEVGNYGGTLSVIELFDDEKQSQGFTVSLEAHAYGDVEASVRIHNVDRAVLQQLHTNLTSLLSGLVQKI